MILTATLKLLLLFGIYSDVLVEAQSNPLQARGPFDPSAIPLVVRSLPLKALASSGDAASLLFYDQDRSNFQAAFDLIALSKVRKPAL